MGSSQENKPRVAPSLWLAALSRQLHRAARRTRTLESEAGPARERARQWLGKTAAQTKTVAGQTATQVAIVARPVVRETRRGLGLLRRRARHTAALVGIPWLKIGGGAALLMVAGFVAFQPRGGTAGSATTPVRPLLHAASSGAATATAKKTGDIVPVGASVVAATVLPTATVAAVATPTRVAEKSVAETPPKRQRSMKRRDDERHREAYSKRAEKWHKKHGKHDEKDDDD